MTKEELKVKLELHKKWLNGEIGGIKLALSYANLRSADLGGADLGCANLRSADLGGANLRSADLRSADLGGANLSYADLSYADLGCANLRSADLGGANLSYADLGGADLSYANLRSADLRSADLRSADLRSANLRSANLRSADLRCCIGNNKEVKSLQIGTYLVSYSKYALNIGCQSHSLDKWKSFTDNEIANMDINALDWWTHNKFLIITLAERECTT